MHTCTRTHTHTHTISLHPFAFSTVLCREQVLTKYLISWLTCFSWQVFLDCFINAFKDNILLLCIPIVLSLLPTGYDLSQDVIERSSGMLHFNIFISLNCLQWLSYSLSFLFPKWKQPILHIFMVIFICIQDSSFLTQLALTYRICL